eukprot:3285560-Pyramimonas_sp.AAC.1
MHQRPQGLLQNCHPRDRWWGYARPRAPLPTRRNPGAPTVGASCRGVALGARGHDGSGASSPGAG